MRDLAFVAFLFAFIGIGFRRPFLFVLAFCYIDIVAPQRLSYFLINSIPISLIVFGLAIVGWIAADDKRDTRWSGRQTLLVILLFYCWMNPEPVCRLRKLKNWLPCCASRKKGAVPSFWSITS